MRILATLIVAAMLFTSQFSLAAEEKKESAKEKDPARETLKKEFPALSIDRVALNDVIDLVRDQSKAVIYLERAALAAIDVDPEKTRVTLKQNKPAKLSDTLAAIVSQLGNRDNPCVVAVCGNVIAITTLQGADRFVKRHRKALDEAKQPGADALDKPMQEVTFDGVGLSDTLEFLRDVGGAPVEVNWKSLEDAGVEKNAPVRVRVRDVKLAQVLRLLLDEAVPTKPIGFKLDGKTIKISQDPDAKDTLPPVKKEKKDGL